MSENNQSDRKLQSGASGSDADVKTLVLQELLSDNTTNGVVSLAYNDFIKYFVKVYVEKSKENPELRECRQEVLLHNQHIEEMMKRVDQLRAAMRVVISQQDAFSRSYNRDLQLNTRTVGVNVRILEDHKRKGENFKDLKPMPEIGTQTQTSTRSIATNTDGNWEKKTLELGTQTSSPSLSTSSTNTQTVLIKRLVRHYVRKSVANTKSPCTTASRRIRLRKTVHGNRPVQNIVHKSEPSEESIFNTAHQPLTAVGENNSPSKIIQGDRLRNIFHRPGRFVKVIRRRCNPPGAINDDTSPKKVISGRSHLHKTSPKCDPSAMVCHESNGPFRKIFRRRRDPLRAGQSDSPPAKKIRLTESSLKIVEKDNHEIAHGSDNILHNGINFNCLPKKQCDENSETADSVSPQIAASSNSSETAAEAETNVSSDNPSQIANPSDDLSQTTSPKSNLFPAAILKNNLHVERSGSSRQVAIRSRGPPQAAARNNCPLPQVSLRGRAPLQVAVRSKGPPQAAVQSNGLPQTGSPLEAECDGSPQTAVRSSGPPQKRARASESPEPKTSGDSPQEGVPNNDLSETTSEKNDIGINIEGSDTPVIKREIESPGITITESDTSSTLIDGQTKTQKADRSRRSTRSTSDKKLAETKESQDQKSSSTSSSSKGKDVEIVDLVSDDDEPPAPPPVKGKATSPKKTIVVPIGTSSTTTPARTSNRPVSILPTLPSAVQLIPTTPTMSASIANGLQVIRSMQAINRPMGPGLGQRVTYLVPSSLFPNMNAQPMTVYRTQSPGGMQNMVTLTPILPPGQQRPRASLTKPGSSTNTS